MPCIEKQTTYNVVASHFMCEILLERLEGKFLIHTDIILKCTKYEKLGSDL